MESVRSGLEAHYLPPASGNGSSGTGALLFSPTGDLLLFSRLILKMGRAGATPRAGINWSEMDVAQRPPLMPRA